MCVAPCLIIYSVWARKASQYTHLKWHNIACRLTEGCQAGGRPYLSCDSNSMEIRIGYMQLLTRQLEKITDKRIHTYKDVFKDKEGWKEGVCIYNNTCYEQWAPMLLVRNSVRIVDP